MWQHATSSQSSLTSDSKLCSNPYRERCQFWSLRVHMSNRMTKTSIRNAKETIIKYIIIVQTVVTHKLLQFEDVNPTVTLCPFLASLFCAEKERRAAFSIAGLSARIHFSNSDLCWVSNVEALSTSRCFLQSPPCAMMLTRTKRTSRDRISRY